MSLKSGLSVTPGVIHTVVVNNVTADQVTFDITRGGSSGSVTVQNVVICGYACKKGNFLK